jgi:hypothetical protein
MLTYLEVTHECSLEPHGALHEDDPVSKDLMVTESDAHV